MSASQSTSQPTVAIEQPINTPYDLYRSIVWNVINKKYLLVAVDDDQFSLLQQVVETAITATLITAEVPNTWDVIAATVSAKLTAMEQSQ